MPEDNVLASSGNGSREPESVRPGGVFPVTVQIWDGAEPLVVGHYTPNETIDRKHKPKENRVPVYGGQTMKPFETIEAALTYAQLWASGPFACSIRYFRVVIDITDPELWKVKDARRVRE